MNTIFSEVQCLNSPVAKWTIQYEYKRSGADMQYRFYWKVWLVYSTTWYDNGLQIQMYINGVQKNVTVKPYKQSDKGWSYEGTTDWHTVSNKTSGTVPFYAVLYDTSVKATRFTSSNYSLSVSGAASALSAITNFDVDNGVTINLTKYDVTFTDTLVVSYGDTIIKTVSSIHNGTKVSFANELTTIYNLMKSVRSGTFTFELTTKSGSTTIGSSTQTATGSITNANPTFTNSQVDYADTNEEVSNITGNPKHIVQNQSWLGVTFDAATGNKGATILRYIIEVNGISRTATTSGSVNFGTINSSQDVTLTITAEDSRGNTTTVKKTVTILAWSLPIFTATVERLNNYEDTTYLTVDASMSSVNGKNEMTVTYMVMQSGGEYGNPEEIENKRQYTVECDKNYVHTFSISVADSFDIVTKEFVLPKGKFPLFIDTQKNAVSINEFPSEGEAFRVAGGVASFDDGIVLKTANKSFKITINDNGVLVITDVATNETAEISMASPTRITDVTLPSYAWEGEGNLYSQVVNIDGITENSQVNLTPSVEQLAIFYEKDITFATENDGGVVTVYVIGQKPENNYTIQASIVEVSA